MIELYASWLLFWEIAGFVLAVLACLIWLVVAYKTRNDR